MNFKSEKILDKIDKAYTNKIATFPIILRVTYESVDIQEF